MSSVAKRKAPSGSKKPAATKTKPAQTDQQSSSSESDSDQSPPKRAPAVSKKTKTQSVITHDKYDSDSNDSDSDDDSSDMGVAKVTSIFTPSTTVADPSKPIPKKVLFADSDDSDDENSDKSDGESDSLRINKDYEEEYTKRKAQSVLNTQNERFIKNVMKRAQREEEAERRLQRRREKRARQAQLKKMREELGISSDSDDDSHGDDSSSEIEDDDGSIYSLHSDTEYLDLLHKLKTKDASLYDKSAKFFADVPSDDDDESDEDPNAEGQSTEDNEKKKKPKKLTYGQMMAQAALEGEMADDDAHDVDDLSKPQGVVETIGEYNARQERIKQEFLKKLREEEARLKAADDGDNKMAESESESEEESESDLDDFFSAPTIIFNPNTAPNGDGDDTTAGGDGNNDSDDDEIDSIHNNQDVINHDLQEAEKIIKQLKRNQKLGVGVNINNVDTLIHGTSLSTSKEAQEKLDREKDAYLTKYILGGWWKSQPGATPGGAGADASLALPQQRDLFDSSRAMLISSVGKSTLDDEDDIVVEANDVYEKELNFRYEEGDGDKLPGGDSGSLISHPRSHLIEDSLRKGNEKRKLQRLQKREKQRQELLKQQEMVKRIRNMGKKIVNQKLLSILKLSGGKLDPAMMEKDDFELDIPMWTAEDLTKDFDPEEHDRKNREIYFHQYEDLDDGEKMKDDDDDGDDDDMNNDDSDKTASSTDDDIGDEIIKEKQKITKKDHKSILSLLDTVKTRQAQEIDQELEEAKKKHQEYKTKLPSIIKEHIKKQLTKDTKEKSGKSKHTNDDDDDSDNDKDNSDADNANTSDEEDSSSSDGEPPILSLRELEAAQQREQMLATTLKKQTEQHQANIKNQVENILESENVDEEAVKWWEQEKKRILSMPQYQQQLEELAQRHEEAKADKGTIKREREQLIREIIRIELEKDVDAELYGDIIVDKDGNPIHKSQSKETSTVTASDAAANGDNPSKILDPADLKFQYVQVPAHDFGLTLEEIFTLSDKELNQRVSMKKLAPYSDDAYDRRHWKELQEEQRSIYKSYMEKTAALKDGKAAPMHPAEKKHRHGASSSEDWKNRHRGNWSTQVNPRAKYLPKSTSGAKKQDKGANHTKPSHRPSAAGKPVDKKAKIASNVKKIQEQRKASASKSKK